MSYFTYPPVVNAVLEGTDDEVRAQLPQKRNDGAVTVYHLITMWLDRMGTRQGSNPLDTVLIKEYEASQKRGDLYKGKFMKNTVLKPDPFYPAHPYLFFSPFVKQLDEGKLAVKLREFTQYYKTRPYYSPKTGLWYLPDGTVYSRKPESWRTDTAIRTVLGRKKELDERRLVKGKEAEMVSIEPVEEEKEEEIEAPPITLSMIEDHLAEAKADNKNVSDNFVTPFVKPNVVPPPFAETYIAPKDVVENLDYPKAQQPIVYPEPDILPPPANPDQAANEVRVNDTTNAVCDNVDTTLSPPAPELAKQELTQEETDEMASIMDELSQGPVTDMTLQYARQQPPPVYSPPNLDPPPAEPDECKDEIRVSDTTAAVPSNTDVDEITTMMEETEIAPPKDDAAVDEITTLMKETDLVPPPDIDADVDEITSMMQESWPSIKGKLTDLDDSTNLIFQPRTPFDYPKQKPYPVYPPPDLLPASETPKKLDDATEKALAMSMTNLRLNPLLMPRKAVESAPTIAPSASKRALKNSLLRKATDRLPINPQLIQDLRDLDIDPRYEAPMEQVEPRAWYEYWDQPLDEPVNLSPKKRDFLDEWDSQPPRAPRPPSPPRLSFAGIPYDILRRSRDTSRDMSSAFMPTKKRRDDLEEDDDTGDFARRTYIPPPVPQRVSWRSMQEPVLQTVRISDTVSPERAALRGWAYVKPAPKYRMQRAEKSFMPEAERAAIGMWTPPVEQLPPLKLQTPITSTMQLPRVAQYVQMEPESIDIPMQDDVPPARHRRNIRRDIREFIDLVFRYVDVMSPEILRDLEEESRMTPVMHEIVSPEKAYASVLMQLDNLDSARLKRVWNAVNWCKTNLDLGTNAGLTEAWRRVRRIIPKPAKRQAGAISGFGAF